MRARLIACAAVAATAAAFALYARMAWPWLVLGWIGLVPWLALLDRTPSLARTLGAGLVMAAAFELAVFGWFASAIQTYTGAPWAVAASVLVLTAPLLQPQLVTFAVARHLARRHGAFGAALVGAGVYVGTEWAIPKLFADSLGHGLVASTWMRQAADLAGAPGLTLVLVLANEAALAAARALAAGAPWRARLRRALAPAACVAALALALLVYGAARCRALAADAHGGDTVTAGVVQADISGYDRLAAERGTYETVRMILDTHFDLSRGLLRRAALDVLVWPETVYPTTFGTPKSADGAAFDGEIVRFTTAAGVPLVFGAYDAEGGDEFNAAVFLEPVADGPLTFDTYRKASPFPLTEHVPALLESERVRRWLPWLGTWKAGAGAKVVGLRLRDGRTIQVAPLICYDVLDPELARAAVRRGAEMILTLSNDSWFAAGAGPRLHLVGAVFLSLETRRPQVRATNTGISAVITPTGDILASAGLGERATLIATVKPERRATTLVLAWGDWLAPSALAGALLLLAAPAAKRERRA